MRTREEIVSEVERLTALMGTPKLAEYRLNAAYARLAALEWVLGIESPFDDNEGASQ